MGGMRNPLLLIILNFIVGAMVSKGLVQPNDHNTVVEYAADLVGLSIIMLTTGVSLMKVIKHKHPDELMQPVPSMTTGQHDTLRSLLQSLENTSVPQMPLNPPAPASAGTGTPPLFTEQGTMTGVPNATPSTEQVTIPTGGI